MTIRINDTAPDFTAKTTGGDISFMIGLVVMVGRCYFHIHVTKLQYVQPNWEK